MVGLSNHEACGAFSGVKRDAALLELMEIARVPDPLCSGAAAASAASPVALCDVVGADQMEKILLR